MRVLVVDDDPVILDLLRVILQQEGHESIHVAESGQAALDILGRKDDVFDVLILDIAMPSMDGITLCRKIRDLPAYADTPIIMLTAKSDSLSIESAFAAGANDYITKPFDVKGIGVRIQIAERMMREGCKTYSIDSQKVLLTGTAGSHDFDLGDPVRINKISQHTDPFSLGNYLSQLARTRVDKTSVFAAKIGSFKDYYESCTSQELLVLISEVWNGISSSADNSRLLGAYVGSGTFICIATDDVQEVWPAMEHQIGSYLDNSEAVNTSGLSSGISVTLGRPFRPNASKTKRVRPTFDRALSLLERRLKIGAAINR